ncbi:hypothetical protein F7Q99_29105 [Streptomyces kaniharaensis]|uniref:Tetratricopeptide repeat protein n=1 Tax=Streptomyces kaniharaensis TaxID=212423 RepID=A0A6N7L008_9ACTN|nr:hypothetical protein [Streptomyces kaniharaensis]MQS16179.1 hypothetical protein [Streptomyces kaniharaensis]
MALESYTRLLARHGRAAEAFALLLPHADDWALATALVDVAAVAGRDDEAAALLAARIRVDHRCDGPCCCRGLGQQLQGGGDDGRGVVVPRASRPRRCRLA